MSKQFYCVLGLIASVLSAGTAAAGFWPEAVQPYFLTAGVVGVVVSAWLSKSPINHDNSGGA